MSRLQYDLGRPGELGRADPRSAGADAGRRAAPRGAGGGQYGHAPSLLRPGCGAADARAVPLAHAGRLPLRGVGNWDGRGRPNSCPAWADSSAATCSAASWPRAWTSRRGRTRSSTSAPTARWWWGRRRGSCVRPRRPARRLKAGALARGCGRARAPSTACTCATAGSTATSSAAARRAASAAAGWWTRRRAASNWA